MSVHEEIVMLKESIKNLKSKMANTKNKRERLLYKERIHTASLELAMAQAEERNGYGLNA